MIVSQRCGPILSTIFGRITTMNFDYFDVISSLARERQNELIQEAAARRMLRSAKEAHPSRGRLARVFRHDPAS